MTTSPATIDVMQAQLGIPVPIAFGRVRAKGNLTFLYELADKSRVAFIQLADGEWDGIDRLWINRKLVDRTDTTLVHFHAGTEGVLGAGLAATSLGGDQGVDQFFTLLPASVQKVTFSGRAYIALHVPADPGAPTAELDVVADYRTMMVRSFDGTGAQTGYAFSTNPAWCILEVIIRFMLKRDALKGAALSAAEKARLDFPSFVQFATDCDVDIGAGKKRFEMNVAFPQVTSLTNVLEQMLVMSRAYIVEERGVISIAMDKSRASKFTLLQRHVLPGSFKVDKRQARGQANQFIGHFNDLNVPIVTNITSSARVSNVVTHTTAEPHPFAKNDTIEIFDVDDASFNGTVLVADAPTSTTLVVNQTAANATTTNGKIGVNEARYGERAPIVNHEQHQNAVGQTAIGLARVRTAKKLDLDYGNNTGERVRRLLAFQKTRQLGVDGLPYVIPKDAYVAVSLLSVDDLDQALLDLKRGDVITVNASVSVEHAGDYELLETTYDLNSTDRDQGGMAQLYLKEYVDNAFTDVAPLFPDPRGGMVKGGLSHGGGPANQAYKVVLSAAISAVDAGTTATITLPSFYGVFAGVHPNPQWGGGDVTNCAFNTRYFLYVDDPDLHGGTVAIGATTDSDVAMYTAGRIYINTIKTPLDGAAATADDGDSGSGSPLGRRTYLKKTNMIDQRIIIEFGGTQVLSEVLHSPESDSYIIVSTCGAQRLSKAFTPAPHPGYALEQLLYDVEQARHKYAAQVAGKHEVSKLLPQVLSQASGDPPKVTATKHPRPAKPTPE